MVASAMSRSITVKIPTIVDRKLKKTRNFENKQPNCTILFIFVFQLSFIDCILSKIVGFDQLWTAITTKIGDNQQKTCSLQNAQHFLSVYCPKLSLFFTVMGYYRRLADH